MLGVEGSLRVDQFQDKDGNNKSKTYVLVSNIEYLSSAKSGRSEEKPQEVETDPFADFGQQVSIDDNFLD